MDTSRYSEAGLIRDLNQRIAELEAELSKQKDKTDNYFAIASDRFIENQRLREGIMGCAVEINQLTGPHENSLRAVSTKLAELLREE